MKSKNKKAIIALLLALTAVMLLSLQILYIDVLVAGPLLDKLCPMNINCSPENPYDCTYSSCIWEFILFVPFFIPALLSIVAVALGASPLRSEKRIDALLAIGIAILVLLFYLWMLLLAFFS